MLELAGIPDADVADALDSGRAMDSWRRMITAQGGDPDAPLPTAPHTHTVVAPADGYVSRLDARALGVGSWRLGAGRARKEDSVQATAGIEILVGYGEKVAKGQPLLTLHTETPERFERALEAIEPGVGVESTAPQPRVLIHDEVR